MIHARVLATLLLAAGATTAATFPPATAGDPGRDVLTVFGRSVAIAGDYAFVGEPSVGVGGGGRGGGGGGGGGGGRGGAAAPAGTVHVYRRGSPAGRKSASSSLPIPARVTPSAFRSRPTVRRCSSGRCRRLRRRSAAGAARAAAGAAAVLLRLRHQSIARWDRSMSFVAGLTGNGPPPARSIRARHASRCSLVPRLWFPATTRWSGRRAERPAGRCLSSVGVAMASGRLPERFRRRGSPPATASGRQSLSTATVWRWARRAGR